MLDPWPPVRAAWAGISLSRPDHAKTPEYTLYFLSDCGEVLDYFGWESMEIALDQARAAAHVQHEDWRACKIDVATDHGIDAEKRRCGERKRGDQHGPAWKAVHEWACEQDSGANAHRQGRSEESDLLHVELHGSREFGDVRTHENQQHSKDQERYEPEGEQGDARS